MNQAQIIQILIYSHALFGGIALLSGFISLIAKKGKKTHKKSGKLFYYCMLLSASTALVIASLPNMKIRFYLLSGFLVLILS